MSAVLKSVSLPVSEKEAHAARARLKNYFPDLFSRQQQRQQITVLRFFVEDGGDGQTNKFLFNEENSGLCVDNDSTTTTAAAASIKYIFFTTAPESFVSFYMQIHYYDRERDLCRRAFTNPEGAPSNYFYSVQPSMYTHWAKYALFSYDAGGNVHVDVPSLQNIGFGMFRMDDLCHDIRSCQVHIDFTAENAPLPNSITFYIVRQR